MEEPQLTHLVAQQTHSLVAVPGAAGRPAHSHPPSLSLLHRTTDLARGPLHVVFIVPDIRVQKLSQGRIKHQV